MAIHELETAPPWVEFKVKDVWVPLFEKLIWIPATVCGDCDKQNFDRIRNKHGQNKMRHFFELNECILKLNNYDGKIQG